MNGTPNGLGIRRIKGFLEQIQDIIGVHHLHAWNVCSSSVAFSCHVVVPDQRLSKIDSLSERIRRQLFQHFGIDHPILQFEATPCGEPSMLSALSCGAPEDDGERPKTIWERRGSFFKKPLLFWVRLILGAVFILASVDKILRPAAFAQMIYNYQILPDTFINISAIVLPWVELLLGCSLLFGFWLPGAITLANLLLATFFVSLLFNVARGLNVHCGCFSTSTQGAPATAWYLVRDTGFLLMGGYLFFKVLINRPQIPTEGTES